MLGRHPLLYNTNTLVLIRSEKERKYFFLTEKKRERGSKRARDCVKLAALLKYWD